MGLSENNNPSEWKNLDITWEKNEAELYVVSGLDFQEKSDLKEVIIRLVAQEDAPTFENLKEINIASAGVKECVIVDQPLLEKVSLNDLGKAPLTAVNIQGGKAIHSIDIKDLPEVTDVFLGGDSLINVELADLPNLQEQSNLHFRVPYNGNGLKESHIQNLTLSGNLSKLNDLYLNDLGFQSFNLETTLPEATGISLNKNRLTGTLDLKGLQKLTSLYLRNNQLQSISISDCPTLKEFDASSNKSPESLTLDLSSLTHLDASETALTSLDITHLTALKNISVSQSKLSTLTFDSNNKALERINLSNNALTSFVLPAEINQPYQNYLSGNQLKTLDMKHAGSLEELYISNNELETFILPYEKRNARHHRMRWQPPHREFLEKHRRELYRIV